MPLLGRLEATIAPVGQVKAGFSVTSDGIDFSGPTYEGGVQVAVSADVGPLEAKVEGEALLTTDMPTTNLAASLGTDAANVQAGDDGIQVGVGVPGGDVGIGANPIAAMSDAFHALTQAISNLSDRLAGIVGATDFGQGLVEMGSGGNPFR